VSCPGYKFRENSHDLFTFKNEVSKLGIVFSASQNRELNPLLLAHILQLEVVEVVKKTFLYSGNLEVKVICQVLCSDL